MSANVIAYVIVGGIVTGLLRHAIIQMDEHENGDPMESDHMGVRFVSVMFYLVCLFTAGYLFYKLFIILIHLIGG